ncbi:MAG: YeeE/YedE thiosulfate transporter family protein [Fusobacterium sp. JB021]|nr:YeeE/YedE thiosulfate transporter family protein [Fusobacterium sp. JB020]MDP0494068.1 YeeE/YedE thiosulfate transporter family protein [Fusobacterium sp. JB021]MDP0506052.1 YeeE/YedE thiosulfate transporter family protein [Fusobacterium sp. JB019]
MKTFIKERQWSWFKGGIILGLIFVIAVALVKPIGVSTQFVIFDGVTWNSFHELVVKDAGAKSGFASFNAYINKSGGKYAKSIANPLNYSYIFVFAMILGGFVASRLKSKTHKEEDKSIPKVWEDKFGKSHVKRYLASFLGGIFVLFGARLAGGCTSGHMMSGMMQTSLSGYLFTFGTFIVAIPVAIILYKGGKKEWL